MVAPRAVGVGTGDATPAGFEVLVECPACGTRAWVSTDGIAAQCACGAQFDPAGSTVDAADVSIEMELVQTDGTTSLPGRLEWIDGTRWRFTTSAVLDRTAGR